MRSVLTSVMLCALAGGLAACGEDPKPAAGPASEGVGEPGPRLEPVFELPPVAFREHGHVYRFVADSIRAGQLDALRTVELPPRIVREDLAVDLLRTTLNGSPHAAPDLPSLFAGLDALAEAPGGTGGEVLAGLLAKWKAWTPEQVEQAKRYAAWRRTLEEHMARDGDLEPDGSPRAKLGLAPEGEPAPGCPFAPAAPMVQAVRLARSTPPGPLPPAFHRAVNEALENFRALGWTAGFGHLVQPWIDHRRKQEWRSANDRLRLGELAITAYRDAKNPISQAAVHLRRADAMAKGRLGPLTAQTLKSAAANAEDAIELMTGAGEVGPNLVDAYLVAARTRLRAGEFVKAAEHARRAGEVSDELGGNDKGALVAGSVEIPAWGRAGRFMEVVRRAEAYWKRAWSVEALQELGHVRGDVADAAAVALVAVGELEQALAWLDRAAQVHAGGKVHGQPAMTHVQAMDVAFKLGDGEARWRTVQTFLSDPRCPPQVAAAAADVLYDHDRAQAARAVLARLKMPPAVAAYFRARHAAASGEASVARREFETALRGMVGTRQGPQGRRVARVATKWAEFEESQGNLTMAAWRAFQATYHLANAGEPADLHAAYLHHLTLERRRLEFGRAGLSIQGLRGLGMPENFPKELDARLDEVLVLLEGTLHKPDPVAALENVDKVIDQRVPGAQRKALAKALIRAAATGDGSVLSGVAIPEKDGRWSEPLGALARLLALPVEARTDARVRAALQVIKSTAATDPEIRRLAARFALLRIVGTDGKIGFGPAGPSKMDIKSPQLLWEARRLPLDQVAGHGFVELAATLEDGAVFRAIEPLGGETLRLTVTRSSVQLERWDGASALIAYRDELLGPRGSPSGARPTWASLTQKADAAYAAVTSDLPEGTTRLIVSLGKPIGALPLELGRPADGSGPTLWIAASATEVVKAAATPPTNALPDLDFPDSPLRSRHALVVLAPFDGQDLRAFHAEVAALRTGDVTTPQAVVAAIRARRAKWKPEGPVAVPLWAAVGLRGAP